MSILLSPCSRYAVVPEIVAHRRARLDGTGWALVVVAERLHRPTRADTAGEIQPLRDDVLPIGGRANASLPVSAATSVTASIRYGADRVADGAIL
jgi:hypothetical protein